MPSLDVDEPELPFPPAAPEAVEDVVVLPDDLVVLPDEPGAAAAAAAPEVVAAVVEAVSRACQLERNPMGTFAECPMCGGALAPEHAHFRCTGCGWRDSCCD